MTGRAPGLDPDHVQSLTERAHEATEGRPNPLDWVYNETYYVRWMRWIYEQLGISAPVPEHELACAWHFMCWQVGKRYSAPACASVVETLQELRKRGYRLGVLSNNSGYVADALAYSQIGHLFEIVVDSAREGRVKPDPELFRVVARRIGVSCEALLYVGDSYECDVIGATLAGMGAAWIGGDDRPLPERAFRIAKFAHLLLHLPAR
jgi:HAD superfamily hydrolase (TIGR01549 family)